MLVQFTVRNFLSIRDRVVLSMVATKRRSRVSDLDTGATFSSGFDNLNLLKCATIYGANASGKSNIVAALGFFRNFILNSSKESQVDEPIKVVPFKLSNNTDLGGSEFEITFIKDDYLYQYGLEVDSQGVRSECLKRRSKGAKRTSVLFERTGGEISVNTSFKEGRGLEKKTRKNALFISVCANFDGEIATVILRWFQNLKVISGLRDELLLPYTIKCFENPSISQKLSELLSKFDLGFERIEVRETNIPTIPDEVPDELKDLVAEVNKLRTQLQGNGERKIKKLVSVHHVFENDGITSKEIYFDFSQESEGTKKIVALAGPLLDCIDRSKVLVIDEFDARLHPLITKTIIELFNSGDGNSQNAQLIAASHDTSLLDGELLRRDQIWFVEKDRQGATHLTSLDEFKVRSDASFSKDYIVGKYGAIPFLGNLRRLFGGQDKSVVAYCSSATTKE
jgi:AAA15 family ATPase/GTPase